MSMTSMLLGGHRKKGPCTEQGSCPGSGRLWKGGSGALSLGRVVGFTGEEGPAWQRSGNSWSAEDIHVAAAEWMKRPDAKAMGLTSLWKTRESRLYLSRQRGLQTGKWCDPVGVCSGPCGCRTESRARWRPPWEHSERVWNQSPQACARMPVPATISARHGHLTPELRSTRPIQPSCLSDLELE